MLIKTSARMNTLSNQLTDLMRTWSLFITRIIICLKLAYAKCFLFLGLIWSIFILIILTSWGLMFLWDVTFLFRRQAFRVSEIWIYYLPSFLVIYIQLVWDFVCFWFCKFNQTWFLFLIIILTPIKIYICTLSTFLHQ